MKSALLPTFLLLCGCAQHQVAPIYPPRTAEPIASIRITEDAFRGVIRRDTGTFFFFERGTGRSLGYLSSYRLSDGKVVEHWGTPLSKEQEAALLAKAPATPFDYSAEVQKTDRRLSEAAKKAGHANERPIVLDGAEYEVFLATRNGPLRFKAWNVGPEIEFFATHSGRIKEVNDYLSHLALFYGRSAMGL